MPWRRRDAYVASSDTLIVAVNGSATGPLVSKCYRNASSTSTSAAFVFAADSGSASYYLYYLPFTTCEYTNGACQYSADVTYSSQQHCRDSPWWPPGTPLAQPTAVAYEGATEFDAFTDMERPMSAAELAAFAASAATPGGLGVVLIAEAAESPARMWGGGGSGGGGGGGNTTAPFCVYAAAAGGYYLKTGGDPAITAGWDQGHSDKCCSSDASDCVWFPTAAACAAFPPAHCRACRASDSDLGCPSWAGAPGTGVQLPYKYATLPPASLATLSATLRRNQNFSFQVLALGPSDTPLVVDSVAFQPAAPPGLTLGCLSTQAVDYWGRASTLRPTVYGLLPLWMTVAVDRAAPVGGAPLTVTVLVTLLHPPTNATTTLPVRLQLTVAGQQQPPLPDGQDSLPRPHWLNSRLGADDASVPRPYTPLAVNASSSLPALFTMHGKAVEVGAAGLPTSILTYGPSASPAVDAARGSTSVLGQGGLTLTVTANATPGAAPPLLFPTWATTAWAGNASQWAWTAAACDSSRTACLTVSGSLDFSGYLALDLGLALGPLASPSTRLALELSAPAAPENLLYGMGLGVQGGYFAKLFPDAQAQQRDWRWDGVNGNNGCWLGSTTGGFLLKAKGADPLWQASVPYDSRQAPPAPTAWANAGQGGIRVSRAGVVTAYTGLLPAAGGGVASLQASLLITPVHNLNLTHHFSLRYAQLDAPPLNYTFLAASGATVLNVHQGNVVNPWINYPYLTNEAMGAAAAACHALGMRFSIYNTMRELSNRCAETYVLKALGETYVEGSGAQGADWLKEHVATDFLPAWSTPIPQLGGQVLDAAMRVVALSRWNNYYVEGIQQMARDFALDGIYLDEIAYDRVTMLRMRKLLDARAGVIDHHSHSGAFCLSPAMIYAEHYPFLDKLWYGEGFDYGAASPDYWLVEMSGLVWGLTADMLRYPGMTPYHFRGMLFGESNRWQGAMDPAGVAADPFSPLALWQLWGQLGIADATLHGFWLQEALGPAALPVATNASDTVKVTTYALPQRALVVVASFAPTPLTVALTTFNNSILGLPGSLQDYCLHAPALPPFQPTAATLALNQSFNVPPGQGWIFVVQPC